MAQIFGNRIDVSDYWKDREGVVQSFEFDKAAIFRFYWTHYQRLFFAHIPFTCCCVPCYAAGMHKKNLEDAVNAQHVCLTQDGVVFVVDKRGTGCRSKCQEKGKMSKTVPFDKITDCDIEAPAGAVGCPCCLVDRTLHTVNIDTASNTTIHAHWLRSEEDWCGIGDGKFVVSTGHELTLVGLKDPEAFKSLVWQMKRGLGSPATQQSAVPVQQQMQMGQESETVSLLREIAQNSRYLAEIAEKMGQNKGSLG